ncbi:hypothetical protein NQ318_002082 [Aromia moschata]|uniref:C2H2-type domain-containing protein n=1 Tax=Aromia moschata TaxID=1265417 RepID=A0AAV8Z3N7_9CUCU|nr:hypothetical protein NQ318_002082 [Aromia moschata]
MTDLCLICLKTEKLLEIGNNTSNNGILEKLRSCVPEVEWNLCFKICNYCKEELFKVYNFKHICIKSYKSWKSSINPVKAEFKESVKELSDISSDNDVNVSENDVQFSDDENKSNVKGSFECFDCKKTFKTKGIVENHIKQKHRTKPTTKRKKHISCQFCGKKYSTENGLRKHLKICRSKADASCETLKDECLKSESDHGVISRDGLQSKTETAPKVDDIDANIVPTCAICGTTFCNKYLLKRHLQNVHATEKKFKCDTCERPFASAVYLNAHKRYHMGDRPHICSFCGKGFITASDLYHHEKIHANKRAYRCEICPKAFNTSSDLHKHKICVHLDRSKWKYVCMYCQRRFPLKTNLDTHIKTHTGEKNYSCHLCDRKCINRSVLMRHIETHSNIIAFKCNLCLQGYKYRKSLDIHMAKIHGTGHVKIPERVKKFFCHICAKAYSSNSRLQKHIRSHNGERPFQCSDCDKTFIDKSYVKQHLKLAHNIVNKLEF